MIIPIIYCGIPKALLNAAAMELDCTALPINPRAKIINTAKIPANVRPKFPLNAARM